MSAFRLCSDDEFYFGDVGSFAESDDREISQAQNRETPLNKPLSAIERPTQSVTVLEQVARDRDNGRHQAGIYHLHQKRKVPGAASAALRPKVSRSSAEESAAGRKCRAVDFQASDRRPAEPAQRSPNVASVLKTSLMAAAVATSGAFGISVVTLPTKVDAPSAQRFASFDSRLDGQPPAAQSSIEAQVITSGIENRRPEQIKMHSADGNKGDTHASETASVPDDQVFPSLSWTPFDPVMLEGGTFWSLNAEVGDVTPSRQQHFVRDWSVGRQSPK